MQSGIMLYVGCKVGVYDQIKVLSELGVKRTFINAKHPEIDKVICAIRDAGLICDNIHAEYAITHNGEKIHTNDITRAGKAGDIMVSRIMRNIDTCSNHGIPILIVHPSNDPPQIAINEFAKERYTAIGSYAREKGVTVAFENLKYTENLKYIMSLIPNAKFCWDCGHEYSSLVDEKPMPLFRDRLAALHIHDNFIKTDDHLIPFTAKVDFDYVGREIAESGFDGTLMLETPYRKNELGSTEPTYKDFALKAKSAAEKIIDIVEGYRSHFRDND